MPGFDGTIASLPGGDDIVVPGGRGQKLETSDPLHPDTDMDGLRDGLERVRGSSPNDPGDTEVTGDSDQDGLTDNIEDSGWAIVWTDANGLHGPVGVSSNPFVPDTDFDGLPDYAERHMPCFAAPTCDMNICSNDSAVTCGSPGDCVPECPTDPTRADTDRDGISDFDELSAEQFSMLARFNDFFAGYFVDGSDSRKYGTDPRSFDTDDDGLSDDFELFVGWAVVRSDGTVTQAFSDPTKQDSDGDGLADNQERTRLTDPTEPDTDSDGRTDGQEVLVGSNPLLPDVTVAVTYAYMEAGGHFDGVGNRADWVWRFYAQHSSQPFPGDTLSDPSTGCGPTPGAFGEFIYFPGCAECQSNGYDFNLNRRSTASKTYSLSPGEAIVLNGWIVNENNCPATDGIQGANCRLAFVDTPLRYEDVQDRSFLIRTFPLTGGGCNVNVVVEVQVNCAGTGRHLCQFGSPCVFDDDCTSGLCTSGRCAANCGNGIPEGPERCDDGNADACGTCNSTCSGSGPGATCPVDMGCASDADCQSGSCFDGLCVAVCGNGLQEGAETCDDGNASSCGTCDELCGGDGDGPTCPVGTTCKMNGDCLRGSCSGGLCVPVCGDGFVDPGVVGEEGEVVVPSESCDDLNSLSCGTCNATCSGAGTGSTCLGGTGCKSNADCASGTCDGGTCTNVCGNGDVEPGEACDDNNTDSCGTCNPSCDLVSPGSDCPFGTGCASDDDCLSNLCIGELCF
jgi:hypothetical protein